MSLNSGEKLGPYVVVAPLGAGGMGEVYKARDTRLDRSVAVKVLPSHIAERADSQARFEREARAVASLNHPHICSLFDIGPGYMVMELIEGETLAARIERGPIPLEQALVFASQIADALDRAHRAGVTHRDVKPGNIMITRDGVKVLDFGLAKADSVAAGPTEATLTKVLTAEGVVLGTPQYMAPEQFEGREADARADIWAFGAVVYEMVTGRKAFSGKSYSSLVGAILAAEPAPMAVKPITPFWLERVVRRCLAKDPERRYQSMRDIVLDLEAPVMEAPAAVAVRRWPWMAVAGACAVLAMVAGVAAFRRPGEAVLPARFEINPPAGSRFGGIRINAEGSAISPDGRTLAFVATNAKGETMLHVRPLDSWAARALAETKDASRPFWSPDSKWLGFASPDGKLKRVELAGGAPTVLCDVKRPRGGTWNDDGVILFADFNMGLQQIAASGGTPLAVTKVDVGAGELQHYYPQFLPGGEEFLFLVRHGNPAKGGIFLGGLDGRPPVQVQPSEYSGVYDPASRRLLYIQGEGMLMARQLELDPPRLVGDSVIVAEGVGGVPANGYADVSISGNGTLLYGSGVEKILSRFGWADRAGKGFEAIGEPMQDGPRMALSPDESRVAFALGWGQLDLWVMSLGTGIRTRITFKGGAAPVWAPDGKMLYYTLGESGIGRKAADGSGEEELFWKGGQVRLSSVSRDGNHLLFESKGDVLMLPLQGERNPTPFLHSKFVELDGTFSPDGRWVAYTSNESGRFETYVQGFPERRGKWLVSADGGTAPRWRGDGKELYWFDPEGRLMAAPVTLQPAGILVGRPEVLFRSDAGSGYLQFAVTRDGQRFLLRKRETGEDPLRPMFVVLNWAAGLGR